MERLFFLPTLTIMCLTCLSKCLFSGVTAKISMLLDAPGKTCVSVMSPNRYSGAHSRRLECVRLALWRWRLHPGLISSTDAGVRYDTISFLSSDGSVVRVGRGLDASCEADCMVCRICAGGSPAAKMVSGRVTSPSNFLRIDVNRMSDEG